MKYKTCRITTTICLIFFISFSLLSQQPQQTTKRNYAVIGMKSAEGVTVGEADIIADRLRIELFSTGKVSMMERDQMQDILKEQGFQQSGTCTDESCMVEIGQLLGVEMLVSGSIGKLGSMFLLNFRAIDVRTGKIVKVVSKDINGGIEDVVKYLPYIASQLIEGGPAKVEKKKEKEPAAEKIEEKKPQEPEVKEEVKPEVVEEKKEPEVQADESVGSSKNKNRGGVRISFNYFPGEVPMEVYNDSLGEYEDVIDKEFFEDLEGEEYTTIFYKKSHFRFQVNFMIKVGEYLTIDVGPGIMTCKKYGGYIWEDLYGIYLTDYRDINWEWRIFAPNISAGINFVKRFYPLKINAGFLVDVNFNIFHYKFNLYEYGYNTSNIPYTYDMLINDIDFGVNVSFGPRVGLEILAGKHVGFNVDFLYRFDRIEKEFDLEEQNSGLTSDAQWKFQMPGIGLSAGVNFYF